ncbi:MAG: GAF domain-containing protein [Deltaproteobacteria bacterium]|nr:GAF domain-containing protein [Deltaproteobacteria bacterium]
MTPTEPTHPYHKQIALTLVVLVLGLATICVVNSTRWRHVTFPGFVVLGNRVVASVDLPHWSVTQQPRDIYQKVVVAVNGHAVATAEELHALVREWPPGTELTYTLLTHERTETITLPSQTFTWRDYGLLFGTSLALGLACALLGIVVWFLKPQDLAARSFCVASLALGTFSMTVLDLYGPSHLFRLHALSEAIFPFAFIHLALVFPVDRVHRFRALLLVIPVMLAVVLGGAYELLLYHPLAYSRIHNLCMVMVGIGATIFLGKVIADYYTTASHLIRQRVRVVFLGFLSGYVFPALLMFGSGISGGRVAVNYAVFTAFLFPLSVGYAIIKHDLFEIDALLKRGAYYLTLTATLTVAFLLFLALLDVTLHHTNQVHAPIFHLLFTLVVVLFLTPVKEYVQRGVDRLFFRSRYQPAKVLETTSAALAAMLDLEDIVAFIWQTVNNTVGVTQGYIFLHAPDRPSYLPTYPVPPQPFSLPSSHPLLHTLQATGQPLSRYNILDSAPVADPVEQSWRVLAPIDVQLLVPVLQKGQLLGFFALGAKESGAFFSVEDRDFLVTLAHQSALSIANALSYAEIATLNASLEQKVEDRTQALGQANTELQHSLAQLEHTYGTLQRSQENLLRAEKMAALGRLTAGIAHEMNTPLGASLATLKIVKDLVREYRASVSDPDITEKDHQAIATDMDKFVGATQQWLEKAAAHIRSLKLHTRDLQQEQAKLFSVVQVIEDTSLLLSHRLRLAQCTVSLTCTATNPVLYGDPSKFGQMLTNLIGNAIDAYQDTGGVESEIRVSVTEEDDTLSVRVQDFGCGIAPDHLAKIFDDFFSTKPFGEGTGLGLSITRDIVTNLFDGTIAVESVLGHGTTFTLRLPQRLHREDVLPASQDPQDHDFHDDAFMSAELPRIPAVGL